MSEDLILVPRRYVASACHALANGKTAMNTLEGLRQYSLGSSIDADAQSQLAALREELDQWRQMVGRICSTIPVADVLASTGTLQDSVDYFKSLHKRLAGAERRNADVERALSGLLFEFDDGVNGGRDEPVAALDYARTLVDGAEFKPTESGASE